MQNNDNIKKKWCKDNKIKLIEVKYDVEDIETKILNEIKDMNEHTR